MGRRIGAAFIAVMTTALFIVGDTATATIVANVPMGTLTDFSVLGTAVTNTGASVFNDSVGVSPGTGIGGVTPDMFVSPATTHDGDATAGQAQTDLSAAYLDADSRAPTATNPTGELGALTLVGGVYEGPGQVALGLTGTLTLDGQNDLASVFIIQTGGALTTAAGSVVTLINGAQECNVFWQLGGAATLGANSVFRGNIVGQAAITVGANAAFHGRALTRAGTVTLATNTFSDPTCAQPPATTTTEAPTTTTTAAATTTTTAAATTTTTEPATTTTTAPPATTTTTAPPATTTTTAPPATATAASTTTTAASATSATTRAAFAAATARRRPLPPQQSRQLPPPATTTARLHRQAPPPRVNRVPQQLHNFKTTMISIA